MLVVGESDNLNAVLNNRGMHEHELVLITDEAKTVLYIV